MKRIDIDVLERTPEQKNTKHLRKSGFVPGVMYGHGNPVPIVVDAKKFNKAIHTEAGLNALFNVNVGEKVDLSVIKDLQRDIFTQVPIHVDFQRINVKEKIEVNVPTEAVGVPIGVKEEGGIMEHMLREIHIRCLPDDIPPHIDVDVSQLGVHDSVKVKDLTPPSGVEFLTTGEHIIFNVIVPKVEEIPVPEAVPAEGAEAAEPEVIAKGKKEEEGAEAGAAGTAKAGAPGAPKAGAAPAGAPKKPEKKEDKK